jgi:hypothetical protein
MEVQDEGLGPSPILLVLQSFIRTIEGVSTIGGDQLFALPTSFLSLTHLETRAASRHLSITIRSRICDWVKS